MTTAGLADCASGACVAHPTGAPGPDRVPATHAMRHAGEASGERQPAPGRSVDGANSKWTDDQARAASLREVDKPALAAARLLVA